MQLTGFLLAVLKSQQTFRAESTEISFLVDSAHKLVGRWARTLDALVRLHLGGD